MAPAKTPSRTRTSTSEAATPATARMARRRSWKRFLRARDTRRAMSASPIRGGGVEPGEAAGRDDGGDEAHQHDRAHRPTDGAGGRKDDELRAGPADERSAGHEQQAPGGHARQRDEHGLAQRQVEQLASVRPDR